MASETSSARLLRSLSTVVSRSRRSLASSRVRIASTTTRASSPPIATTVFVRGSTENLRGIRALLASVEGLELREMVESDVCCGFGGTFCVKYPEVSGVMVGDKTRNAADTGADLLLAGDLGCLMNMAGKMSRDGRPMKARHSVEVLAGMTDIPAIGDNQS